MPIESPVVSSKGELLKGGTRDGEGTTQSAGYPSRSGGGDSLNDEEISRKRQPFALVRLPDDATQTNADVATDALLFPLRSADMCIQETKRSLPNIENLLRLAADHVKQGKDLGLTLRQLPDEDDLPLPSLENEAYENNKKSEISTYCRGLLQKFAQFYRSVTNRAVALNFTFDTKDEKPSLTSNGVTGSFAELREWARYVTCATIWVALMLKPATQEGDKIVNEFKSAMTELMEYFENQKESRNALKKKMDKMIPELMDTLQTWQEIKNLLEQEQALWMEEDKLREAVGGSKKSVLSHKVKLLEKSINQMKKDREKLMQILREMEKRCRELEEKNGLTAQPLVTSNLTICESYDEFMGNLWKMLEVITERMELGKACAVNANWELFLLQKKINVLRLRKLTLLGQLEPNDPSNGDWLAKNMEVCKRADLEKEKANLINMMEAYLARRERSSKGLPTNYFRSNKGMRREFKQIDRQIYLAEEEITADEAGQRKDEHAYRLREQKCDAEIAALKERRDSLIEQVEKKRAALDELKKANLKLEQQVHGKALRSGNEKISFKAAIDLDALHKRILELRAEKQKLECEERDYRSQLERERDNYRQLHAHYTELVSHDNKLLERERAIKTEASDFILNALRMERESDTILALRAQTGSTAAEQLLLHEHVQLGEKLKMVQRLIARANKKIAYHQRVANKLDVQLNHAATKFSKLEANNQMVLEEIRKLQQADKQKQPPAAPPPTPSTAPKKP
ncbi:hypothetical protein D918_01442 [Trichuris suis]|nr:hypothetical protein M513_07074 [Trichuris suis]KHJ48174.1 hypothetical protein D918_01442 [Trichuris suis]